MELAAVLFRDGSGEIPLHPKPAVKVSEGEGSLLGLPNPNKSGLEEDSLRREPSLEAVPSMLLHPSIVVCVVFVRRRCGERDALEVRDR
tara:strand:+ start:2037 stop:2303 length:267 start_codon:yes stop_codon:yes gene_type:complete